MPQPTSADVHVDAILTSISVAYIQAQSNFVAASVFPVVPVDKQSDKYFTYNKGDWFRDEVQKRAPATESAGSGYNLATTPYNCDVWAFHKDLDDQTLANADVPLNPRRDAAQFVAQRMLLRREVEWAQTYWNTGIWGTDTNSNWVTGNPLLDIDAAKLTILQTTGMAPNTLVLGANTFNLLKNNTNIIDRIKYTSARIVTTELLAGLFDIERVLVLTAVKNTGVEGAADNFQFVGDPNSAMLAHVAPTPSTLTPSAGYTFAWRGVSDGLGASIGTVNIPIPERRAERIESQMAWDSKIVATDLAVFFNTLNV